MNGLLGPLLCARMLFYFQDSLTLVSEEFFEDSYFKVSFVK